MYNYSLLHIFGVNSPFRGPEIFQWYQERFGVQNFWKFLTLTMQLDLAFNNVKIMEWYFVLD